MNRINVGGGCLSVVNVCRGFIELRMKLELCQCINADFSVLR